jgi:hypothetical protein
LTALGPAKIWLDSLSVCEGPRVYIEKISHLKNLHPYLMSVLNAFSDGAMLAINSDVREALAFYKEENAKANANSAVLAKAELSQSKTFQNVNLMRVS